MSEGRRVPEDAAQLRAWVSGVLGVRLPRSGLIDGHDGPMSYLAHSFFEGRVPGGGVGSARTNADCVVWANRGGGKTFLGALATVLDLVFKPGVQVRVLAGSVEQGRRMHEHLRVLLSRGGLEGLLAGPITDRRVVLRNGSRAEVLAQSQQSVRGTRVQKLRCDEVELFDREVWEAAQLVTRGLNVRGPWGGRVPGSVEALSTMHVVGGLMGEVVEGARARGSAVFRWGVVDVLERCPEDRVCEGCGLWEECGGLAKERVGAGGHVTIDDALAMKSRTGAEAWASEMLCVRPSRSDAVYGAFARGVHVVDDAWMGGGSGAHGSARGSSGGALWVGGMDFGLRGETAVLLARVASDGRVVIVDEHVAGETLLDAHIERIREMEREHGVGLSWIGIDPAGDQRSSQTGVSPASVLRGAGYRVRSRRTRLADGIGVVRRMLAPAQGEPVLHVHARCERLIGSMERYRFARGGRGRSGSDEPVKDGSDHACDALRYLVINLDRGEPVRVRRYV